MSVVINLEKDSYSWTGKLICPTVEVILDDVVLTEETDYTVSYENNKNIGTGIVKVNAIDNSWSEETTFTITPVSMNDIEVRYEYEDEEFQVVSLPKVHLWLNDYRLLYGIDYAYDVVNRETKFALYSNTTFRSLTANIVDTITMEFKVKKIWVNIGNESFHFDKNEFKYKRSVKKPKVNNT